MVVMPFIIFFLFSARTMRSFVTLGVTYVCGRRCSAWCGACRFYRLQTLWRGANPRVSHSKVKRGETGGGVCAAGNCKNMAN